MTIDKNRLRALAEAAISPGHHYLSRSLRGTEFANAASPKTILALLGEIDRLEKLPTAWSEVYEQSEELDVLRDAQLKWLNERDQLKAENEALRRDAKRYRFLRNQHWPVAYLAVVVNPKVSVKLGHDCPSGDRLDEQVDGAMKRGASHD